MFFSKNHPMRPLQILILLSVTSICPGQDSVDLRVVEPGIQDVGPLSSGLKVQPLGLSIGNGFDQVYQAADSSGPFFRTSGGLFAVFDRSVYINWGNRFIPEVPPGTTFHIGAPDFLDRSEFGARTSVVEEESSESTPSNIHLFVYDNPRLRYVDESTADVSMPRFQTDPNYRAKRLRMLVDEHLRNHPDND